MRALLAFSRAVDGMNRVIGLVVMYGVFVLMGILLWSSISKTLMIRIPACGSSVQNDCL